MEHNVYYCLCNHWTESGIGYAFPKGWHKGHWYEKNFSSVYTIEKMLDAIDEYPGLVVSMELDSFTYEELASSAPDTIARLKEAIQNKKAFVEGGTYGQPLGQDYGGESNIAHLVYGKRTIQDLLSYDLRTFLVEEQWFHPQLPQLLRQSGFSYASLQCQNSGQVKPMKASMFSWRGIDGTTIPTIPANAHMVSCVKQYGDYTYLWDSLQQSEQPLLFQWAEVWVPGMDWGASIAPFEKAINFMKEKKAIFTSLQGYFEQSQQKALEEVALTLDDSNYGNDWYQDGGWGFDGDQIIYVNKECEHWMQAYDALRLYEKRGDDEARHAFWKRLLVLQNHDVSVARGYRAVSQQGVISDANSLFIKELSQLKQDLMAQCLPKQQTYTLASYNGAQGRKLYAFPCEEQTTRAYHEGTELPSSFDPQTHTLYVSMPIQAFETTSVSFQQAKQKELIQHSGTSITYEGIRLSYQGGWTISIEQLDTNTSIQYRAFRGSIGKRNEHDDHFHALSSAHHQFTFAFDGTKHCMDQCSELYVTLESIQEDDLFITMTLSCDLLTLHTSDTPVAFAKSFVKLDKMSKEVITSSYLYCGVYLNMDAYASFSYNLKNASMTRNYPFGEEQTKLKELYALDYVRVQNEETGFTIMTYGNQRVTHNDQEVRFKISKGKMLFDYHFAFKLCFDTCSTQESHAFLLRESLQPLMVQEASSLRISNPIIQVSSLYRLEGKDHYRFVNTSKEPQRVVLTLPKQYQQVCQCDFLSQKVKEISLEDACITMTFHPMEIITVQCDE